MVRHRIFAFILVTIDTFILWLEGAVKPLFEMGIPSLDEARRLHPANQASFPFDQLLEHDYDDKDFESDRIVFVGLPWGQIIPVPFTGDQWRMIHEVSEASGDKIESIIEDIVRKRYEGMNKDSSPGEEDNPFDGIDNPE